MYIPPKIDDIILHLRTQGILHSDPIEVHEKKGTTEGRVYLLTENEETKYVLKLDHSQEIMLAVNFLSTYGHTALMPRLLYSDKANTFIVYNFIPGTTHYNRGPKINWMTLLVKELLNHYEALQGPSQWGRVDSPCRTWREFNRRSLAFAREMVGESLPLEDHDQLTRLFEYHLQDESLYKPYLLHGDTGVHNFVFDEHAIAGVIDPSPMYGPVLYDFTYAFCSSPDDLNLETLLEAFAALITEPIEQEILINEVVFQLYCRIAICKQHHPDDLAAYLEAWQYWKTLN